MPIAVLKELGGVQRLRIVKPGNDANNLFIPSNQVVFDSTWAGAHNIYAAGINDFNGGFQSTALHTIASFPSLGYIPLARVFGFSNTTMWNYIFVARGTGELSVSETGIHWRSTVAFGNTAAKFYWIVYRTPAA